MKNRGMGDGAQGEGAQDRRAKRETQREREARGETGLRMAAYSFIISYFIQRSRQPGGGQPRSASYIRDREGWREGGR